jgi:hypothetical protein
VPGRQEAIAVSPARRTVSWTSACSAVNVPPTAYVRVTSLA